MPGRHLARRLHLTRGDVGWTVTVILYSAMQQRVLPKSKESILSASVAGRVALQSWESKYYPRVEILLENSVET